MEAEPLVAWAAAVFGVTLLIAGIAALIGHVEDSGDAKQIFALTLCWPITLPVLCWRVLAVWFFPKCDRCRRPLRGAYCARCGMKR